VVCPGTEPARFGSLRLLRLRLFDRRHAHNLDYQGSVAKGRSPG
jgi:hypothetical protein